MRDDTQSLYNVIAVLTKRIGGKVVITTEELMQPMPATVTRNNLDGTITLEIIE